MNTVELKQWGNSLAVRLPKAVLSKAGACEYTCTVPAEFLNDILQKISLTYKKSR